MEETGNSNESKKKVLPQMYMCICVYLYIYKYVLTTYYIIHNTIYDNVLHVGILPLVGSVCVVGRAERPI